MGRQRVWWLALVAGMLAPALARAQTLPGPPRVPPATVALLIARCDLPDAPVQRDSADVLATMPAAHNLGTPDAWRQWSACHSCAGMTDAVYEPPTKGYLIVQETKPSPHTFSERAAACAYWLVAETRDDCSRLWRDFVHMYTGENLCYLGLAVGVSAPVAYSYADRRINDWYQNNIRSYRTEEWARAGYALGQHVNTIPIYLGVMAAGAYWQDTEAGNLAYTWSNRTIRALAVGGPAVGILQYGLGAGRPTEGDSRWHPFRDNNSVCGHGYVGAIPFLAAASVTDSPVLKAVFFAGSFWTSWARLDTQDHFTSQIILGWSIAFLSVRSVVQTDRERWIDIVPIEEERGFGMGVQIRY